MSTRTLFALTLAAALLATGCAKKEEPKAEAPAEPAAPAIDLAAEEQAIRNRSGEWMNYANSKDAASIATKIFAADGVLIADEKAHKGTAAIQAALEAEMKANPNGARQLDFGPGPRLQRRRLRHRERQLQRSIPTATARSRRSRARSRRPGPRSTANGACCRMPAGRTSQPRRPDRAATAT